MSVAALGTVVVTDTSILINLIYTGHMALLGRLPGLRFVIPDEVIAEILQPDQQQVVDEAIAAGHVQRESISSTEVGPFCGIASGSWGWRVVVSRAGREALLDRGLRREESIS